MLKKFKKQKNIYIGYSLVEMLIALALISFVLTFVGIALTTMIKASIMSDSRTLARQEVEVLTTSLRLSIGNARAERVQIFNSDWTLLDEDKIQDELSPTFDSVAFGSSGNEIHVLPTKAERWTCIASITKDNPSLPGGKQNFIIRTSADFDVIPSSSISLEDHQKCFEPNQNPELYDYLSFLTSESVNVNIPSLSEAFSLTAYQSSSTNVYIDTKIGLSPLEWIGGNKGPIKPELTRNIIFKTGLVQ